MALARELIDVARWVEPGITIDMDTAITAIGATRARRMTNIKTQESLVRKISSRRAFRREPRSINDVIRYTALIDHDTYWTKGNRLLRVLTRLGYEVTKDLDLWLTPGYKGRNVTIRSPNGELFELQIHTPASLEAAEATHGLYEVVRHRATPSSTRGYVKGACDAIFVTVPIPHRSR